MIQRVWFVGVLAWGLLPLSLHAEPGRNGKSIRVAVYAGEGTGHSLKALRKALAGNGELAVKVISAEAIREGDLAHFDVLLMPGGSGSREARGLRARGREQIRQFVRKGGGYVGICAGAYLATADYPWSLHILNARVRDKKHWNRGKGVVEIELKPRGQELLGSGHERVAIHYAQGPLLTHAHHKELPAYQSLATFRTQVARNGAPRGVMPGSTAIAAAPFGNGRVLCFSAHPEVTRELYTLLWQGTEWAAGR